MTSPALNRSLKDIDSSSTATHQRSQL